MSDIKKLLSKSEEAGKPTEGERGLLINSLSLLSKKLESELRDCDSIIVDIAIQELKSLQAENAELRKQSEWISVDITNIKIGSKLSYRNGKDSIVFDISGIVNDGINGGISQCRIWANITGAKGIYHTYRKDGVSHYESGYDIVKITPPKGE